MPTSPHPAPQASFFLLMRCLSFCFSSPLREPSERTGGATDEGLIANGSWGLKQTNRLAAQGYMAMAPLALSPSKVTQHRGHGLGPVESFLGFTSHPGCPVAFSRDRRVFFLFSFFFPFFRMSPHPLVLCRGIY
jgi:hypothetical protein